jgi:hypothetical protein
MDSNSKHQSLYQDESSKVINFIILYYNSIWEMKEWGKG